MAKLVRPDDLVYDVGANIGGKCETFLAAGARVVCFEPQPRCVDSLYRRFDGFDRVRIIEAGLAAAEGRMALSVCSEADTISTFSESWKTGRFATFKWDRAIDVEVTTLDRCIALYGMPRYCKIDVEGFELEVLKGMSSPVPFLSFEFAIEFLDQTRQCLRLLEERGYRSFNFALGESAQLAGDWIDARSLADRIAALPDPLAWGDIYATTTDETPDELPVDPTVELSRRGLWTPGQPLRLHLGCGELPLYGYVNIDYPPDAHNLMQVKADLHADLVELAFPAESVDEIRLHHVFEHFPRVVALALLIRWHRWLKPGGVLRIETPDFEGSAQTIVSNAPLAHKLAAARHLAGDQAASWAYHVDLWFPERFERTLRRFGFGEVRVERTRWPHPPHLANVVVSAVKRRASGMREQLAAADELLWDATVASAERRTWEVWRAQLRSFLDGAPPPRPGNTAIVSAPRAPKAPDVVGVVFSKDRPLQLEAALRSLALHARDRERLDLKVLYFASDDRMRALYRRVADEHPSVGWIEERDFVADLRAALEGAPYWLFLVDDTVFVDDFSFGDAVDVLATRNDVVGFSLRLGRNTTYVYPLDRTQPMPSLEELTPNIIAWDWTRAELAFGYPLEVSSSVYRSRDIAPLLAKLDYSNPNSLEAALAVAAPTGELPPRLASFARSAAFSAPLNVVQQVFDNRRSSRPEYAAHALAEAFAAGDRLDVAAYDRFVPNGCHAEIELVWLRGERPAVAVAPEPAPHAPPVVQADAPGIDRWLTRGRRLLRRSLEAVARRL